MLKSCKSGRIMFEMYCLTLLTYFAFALSGISALFGLSSTQGEHNLTNYSPPQNICHEPLGGIEWILHKRRPDFGWKEDTHRAIIALAVNDWKNVPQSDIRQNELQLEIEITRALLRAGISTFHANDLALYIHALIAINRNPRDFHGIDLVEKLLKVVENEEQVHPFLILALCNAKAVSSYHLDSIVSYTGHEERETSRKIEYKALAVKALACAEDLRLASYLHTRAKEHGIQCLRNFQKDDGHFGNVYTTALSVQALIASNILDGWKKDEAIEYLKSQSTVNVNMISTYYIQLALNTHRYKFVKDINPHLVIGRAPEKEWYHNFIQYTIRTSKNPDVYFTITINAAPNTSFFDIMKLSQEQDSKFKFSYYLDAYDRPAIYSISDVPNDAEENLYWRLCLQREVLRNGSRESEMVTIPQSPQEFMPGKGSHIIFWYKDSQCEK